MLNLALQLFDELGINPSIRINREFGDSAYIPSRDEIVLNLAPELPVSEQYWIMLHEIRHAYQCYNCMFLEMRFVKKENMPSAGREYFDLPWEKDANDWAKNKGIELGLWDENYLPCWISNPSLIDGWNNVSN